MASLASASSAYILACQKNSYLRTLVAKVVSCQLVDIEAERKANAAKADAAGGKKKKKKKKKKHTHTELGQQEPENAGTFLDVVLEDTVLFAEGGGQPWDTGSMTILTRHSTTASASAIFGFGKLKTQTSKYNTCSNQT